LHPGLPAPSDKPDPKTYRGLTWSWVSIDDPIAYYEGWGGPPGARECSILSIAFKLSLTADDFGPVDSAILRLKGPALEVRWYPSKDLLGLTGYQAEFAWFEHDNDEGVDMKVQLRLDTREDEIRWGDIVTLLAIDPGSYDTETVGLALVPNDKAGRRYRRLGEFSIRLFEEDEDKDQESLVPQLARWPERSFSIV